MVHFTGARPSVLSLALVSVGLVSCSNESSQTALVQARTLALETSDSGSSPDTGSSQLAAVASCGPRDATCDALDDDCDGRFDEDFQRRCVFGSIALACVDGRVAQESCDDRDPCTVDSCDNRGCHHVAVRCDDSNPCTVDSCSAGSCRSVPATGASCDDGDACSSGDTCTGAGSCGAGPLVNADDGNPCTVDVCDPIAGVTHVPAAGTSCDDHDICSQNDVCTATGTCAGMPSPEFNDGDPCTADACDSGTGAISHMFVAVGTSCSDGDACNGPDSCELLPELEFTVDSRSSFYRVETTDQFQPPDVVKLADVGLRAGQKIYLHTEGTYISPPAVRASVIFSSDPNLLPQTELHRVSGAIQSDAPPSVTGVTFFEQLPTDIPEDFRVDGTGFDVHIPAGALYMFISNFDGLLSDNSGSLTLLMRAEGVGCAPSTPPVLDDGNVCTADACDPSVGVTHEPVSDGTSCAFETGPGACVEGQCVACSAQPEACQLPGE